ncbi:hypothetical protein [Maridesulfovibrio sp.]|uniref:hypothetical protein n=1 Tax=Maridesulfovibrio sp. TaxID=2795000 RepID=UPI003BA9CB2E
MFGIDWDISNTFVEADDFNDLKKKLVPLLYKQVFHSTDEHGFHGILKTKEILSGPDCKIKRQWPKTPAYFYEKGFVSLCDFYHPKKCSHIRDGYRKYSFFRHGHSNTTYLLLLKKEYYNKLITWYDIKAKDDWVGKQIVPYIESGLKSPISLNCISQVIKIKLWEEPYWPSRFQPQ